MPNTLRVKRGLAASLPNGASGEPLFTTDTYELYIGKGDGTNQRYQKYIASGTTSQYLRGDGSLETHNLDSLTDVVVSSPSNGQFLKYNGTNWVNSAGGFLTGGATAAGQVGVFDSTTNIVGYTTFTYDTVTDKLSMTNGYVNNTLTVDGQLVIKSESGASAYTRGLKFPDNSYGGTGDIAGLRLHNAGGENIILELYAGNDSLDTINFAVAAGGSTYNDNVTINGNKIWNAGNLPSPLSSTGTINSGEIPIFSNSTTVYSDTALFWDNSLNRLGVGGTSPNAQVGVSTSSGVNAFGYRTSGASYYELVLAYDNTTYGHTFQANRGASTSAKNITFLNGSNTISIDESGNMGIGLVTPNAGTSGPGGLGLDIYASTTAALALHNSTSGTGISAGGRIYYNSTNMTVRNLSAGNLTMTADSGNFVVITNGAENVKVEGSSGKVGIGNPASIAEMLTVNGSIQQSAVTSAITKTDANGKIVAAVAGTDYVAPSALSGYVPTSRTITINGTSYDLSANRSWSVGTVDGSGSGGRVTYWSDADTVTSDGGFIYDSSTKRLGVNTTVPNATIGATAASGYGLLIKNADSNYGGIGLSIDATYGNLINTEKVGTAPARNLTLLNQSGYISLDESGNMGVNILTPNASTSGPGGIGIDIYSSTTAALAFHNSTSGTGSAEGGRIYYNSTNMTIRNLETGNISITADNGNFQVITNGAENIKVEGSSGKVGIGAPASIAEMLTVNGSIQQSAVTSSMLKANASGKIIAAVSNTDFQAPITLTTTGTSGAATFNGTTLNIPQYQAAGNYITGAGNSGYLPKYTGSYTIANSLVYDNGSRVMINTTTDNTVEMLQVNGGIRGTSLRINSNANTYTAVNVLGQIYVDNRSSQGGNRIFLTPNTTSTTPYVHFYEPFTAFNTNGGISIGTSNAITTTPTDSIMHWDANNLRVGIGTTSPSQKLHIVQDTTQALFEGGTQGNIIIQKAGTSGMSLNSGAAGTLSFYDNNAGAERMRIDSNGVTRLQKSGDSQHLVNTTSTTGARSATWNFQENGTNIFQIGFWKGNSYDASHNAVLLRAIGADDIHLMTQDTTRMIVTSGGKIGIGLNMTSPVSQVSIGVGNVSTVGALASAGLAINSYDNNIVVGNLSQISLGLQNVYTPAYIGYVVTNASAYSYGDLIFGTRSVNTDTAPTERMRITSGGNVGVATTDPKVKFEVAGFQTQNLRLYGLNGVEYNGLSSNVYYNGSVWTRDNGSYGAAVIHFGSDSSIITFNVTSSTSGYPPERMRITSGGSVMINDVDTTYSSNLKLYVKSAGNGWPQSSGTSQTYGALRLRGGDNAVLDFGMESTRTWLQATDRTALNSTYQLFLNPNGGEVITSGQTDNGAYNLQCNGTGVWGAGAYVNGSDISLKENINPILKGLDFVSKMKPVSYNYIESYSKDRSLQTGFIAQDLIEVFEGQEWIEGIVKKGNQYYNVAYQNLIPILVKAIQEQQAQIEELKSKLN